jgi:hypothetical protein
MAKCIDRLKQYQDESFDRILIKIRKGEIKCGKYAHLVKVDQKKKLKGKVFFQHDDIN